MGDLYKTVCAGKWSHLGSPLCLVYSGAWGTSAGSGILYSNWYYWSSWVYSVLWGFGATSSACWEIVFTADFGLLWLVSVLWGFGLVQKWLIQRELITNELKTI